MPIPEKKFTVISNGKSKTYKITKKGLQPEKNFFDDVLPEIERSVSDALRKV